MRTTWPSAPGGRPTAARSIATEGHPPRLRPGRDPVRRPRPAPDQPRHAPHARSTGCAAAHVDRSAPLGGSRAPPSPAHRRSGQARIGLHHGPVADRPAPRVSPPSPRHRLAPAGSGTPGTHPRHPRSVPARPLRARTLCRAYARPVFRDLGSGLDFGIEIRGVQGGQTTPRCHARLP